MWRCSINSQLTAKTGFLVFTLTALKKHTRSSAICIFVSLRQGKKKKNEEATHLSSMHNSWFISSGSDSGSLLGMKYNHWFEN